MAKMTSVNILSEISFLYELSLSIGKSLTLQENCKGFLTTLMSRRNLDICSVWIKEKYIDLRKTTTANPLTEEQKPTNTEKARLAYIQPDFKFKEAIVDTNHFIFDLLAYKGFIAISFPNEEFNFLLDDTDAEEGVLAIFKLLDVGYLKLFSSISNHFDSIMLNQLSNVVNKFAISIEGALAHEKLLKEIEYRKQTENDLKDSQESYRSLVDSIREVIFKTDGEGTIEFINKAWTSIMGFDAIESIGANLLDYLYDVKQEEGKALFLAGLNKENYTFSEVVRWRTKTGAYKWLEVLAQATLDNKQEIVEIAGTLNDITERKKAEFELKKQEYLTTSILDALPVNVFLKDRKGKVIAVNEHTAIGLRTNKQGLIGKHYSDIFPTEVAAQLETYDEQAHSSGTLIVSEDKIPLRGIERYFLSGRKTIQLDAESEPLLLGYSIDITQRKQVDIELKKQQHFTQQVIDTDPNLIFVKDGEGHLLLANYAVLELFNASLDQSNKLLDATKKSILHNPEIDKLVIEEKQQVDLEEMFVDEDGVQRWFQIIKTPLNQDDERVHILGIATDITQRRTAELAQQVLLKEVQSANKDLQDFAYIVSHDLKAPLRAIRSLADWIAEDYEDVLDDEGKEHIALMKNRVKRMYDLIDGILRYSRVGRERETASHVNLNELLEGVVDTLMPPKHIEVIVDDLPIIVCEQTRMSQVFQNLISNAIKYMDKPKGLIRVTCEVVEEHWQFCVADNGPGISPKYFKKVFQIFQTLTSKERTDSTGVGLTVVRKIVEMYGGKAWVTSELTKGCQFYFTFPKN